jgi:hypothetical protein
MEELIGIIATVAILIFKLVAKKMDDSADKHVRPSARPLHPEQGQPESMRQYETFEEVFPGLDYDYVTEVQKVAPMENVEPQAGRKVAPAVTVQATSKNSEKKEKIDPKKLVVYSEIMNRKY